MREGVVDEDDGLFGCASACDERLNADERCLWHGRLNSALSQMHCDLRCERLVAVANHGGDTGQGREFFWCALGVATGRDDARLRIEAVGSTDERAGFSICFAGDAAGVDHNHICVGVLAFAHSRGTQQARDRFAVGARGATAEVFDMEGRRHISSLSEMTRFPSGATEAAEKRVCRVNRKKNIPQGLKPHRFWPRFWHG